MIEANALDQWMKTDSGSKDTSEATSIKVAKKCLSFKNFFLQLPRRLMSSVYIYTENALENNFD